MEEKTITVPVDVLEVLKSAAWLWSQEPIHSDDSKNIKFACHKVQALIDQSGLPKGDR